MSSAKSSIGALSCRRYSRLRDSYAIRTRRFQSPSGRMRMPSVPVCLYECVGGRRVGFRLSGGAYSVPDWWSSVAGQPPPSTGARVPPRCILIDLAYWRCS